MARALWFDLPHTFRLLAGGEVYEYVAWLVVSETRHLDGDTGVRWTASSRPPVSTSWGRGRGRLCRRQAYRADPQGFVDRAGPNAPSPGRLRPAPDTMAVLTGYLPAE